MSRRSRSLLQRAREHIVFSVVAIGVLFIVLRLVGVRSTFAGFVMSVGITLALNIGLSYYSEHRARSPRRREAPNGGGDIRWREDDPGPRDDRRSRDEVRSRDERLPRDDRDPRGEVSSREARLRRREEELERRELDLRRREERGRPERR